ncbi:nicotinate-nucleotide--dimethylbenzimidazole phosphoribosyltransferase [Kineosphaera limosa]|uniref:Nicotinate-nucleotide--dimethylbenzimidazole phosphoribosyltransferase n=1 Tax=Kineosphaera limosa NBRC 100340 TaxID=1184609 RepID=K6XDM0_9MICO|nr:nicotinate-nucleotide--dimethylbenzimidazole phosphoribosyltransferase [Kineosphaera limosa]NYD99057.1 nicotinate-nucleotide--dimethylbenzimidazole phosphoribosyltransferase [Kineosphaera limosa]GAB96909.1 nicotinate-nucleotide--dimethylbenzimidazole phosphoribosyltransferase [Kineosphaera limosa NBRC 100340]
MTPTQPTPATHEPPLAQATREALEHVIASRRDIRSDFTMDPIDDETLTRLLAAAHRAPSVGLSQPWDFVIVRDEERRRRLQTLAADQRDRYAASLPGGRARSFDGLKVEAILSTPLNIVVTCDPTRGGPYTLGRHADPRMAPFSVATAVQNLWLAARAEGIGVGWVSFFDPDELRAALDLPEHLQVVAYLCVGHVRAFPSAPELALSGWARRRPLSWAVHHERWGARGLPGGEPMLLVDETIAAVAPVDEAARAACDEHQLRLTKPAGSLGELENVAAKLSAIAGTFPPPLPEPAALAVFCGDHGVHAQGVSPWPQAVTTQMVLNVLAGGAMTSVLARGVGAEVAVIDVGVAQDLPQTPGLMHRKVAAGTADMTLGPAMTQEQCRQAIEVGIDVARDLVAQGNRLLATGDLGIANTTPSAALVAVFTQTPARVVTGRGTGIDDAMLAHKISVVERAIEVNDATADQPLAALAAVGGFEHAALVGFLLGAAALRTPVVLDGVIAASAALVAARLSPPAVDYWFAGHVSAEPASRLAVADLELRPLLDLDLRLGEGSGAVLAIPLVQGAARVVREGATFESAGVAGRDE